MDSGSVNVDTRVQRAEFDGILIAVLAYGGLLTFYIQLVRVLLTRPKRGKVFWGITIYSSILILLATFAVGGKIKYAEYVYVDSRFNGNFDPSNPDSWIPSQMLQSGSALTMSMMSGFCTVITMWFGDVFMIYRLMVVWSYKWWLLMLAIPLYISHLGMSVPLLIALTKADQAQWVAKSQLYGIAYHCLCVALNVMITALIASRLLTMRKKLEIALGRLHASFYTSWFTIIIESGVFSTVWGIIYLATMTSDHWSQYAFLQPYYYVIAITRMLIVLKMAQNKAWSRDIISAANQGVMDWEVSSIRSTNDGPVKDFKAAKFLGSSAASADTLH